MTPDDLVAEIPSLYRFARALVRDDDCTANLTQDTLTRAIERSHQYRNDAPIGAWLKRILRNIAIDRARRSEREVIVDDIETLWRDDEYTVDPASVIDRAATRDELEDALARLPFIFRSTVLLHDTEDWTVQEIAALDESKPTSNAAPPAHRCTRHSSESTTQSASYETPTRSYHLPSPNDSPTS